MKPLNIVYIIGAGASAALSGDGRIPMMRGILGEMWKQFTDEWKPIEEDLSQLGIHWQEPGKVNREFGYFESACVQTSNQYLDLEGLMHLLEELCASSTHEDARKAEAIYERLIDLTCRLFSRMDRDFVSQLSPDQNIYRSFARKLGRYCGGVGGSHTFISLNYDIWLEQALGDENIWEPVYGYVETLFPLWFKSGEWCNRIGNGIRGRTIVLKPHGSISWFVPREDPYAPPLILLEKGNIDSGGKLKDGRVGYLLGNGEYLLTNPDEKLLTGNYRPLVMPPTSHKGILGVFMSSIYARMDSELLNADVVVVIGWSMPVTDLLMRLRLYDKMSERATRIPKCLIICDINPTRVFYNRYAALIPAKQMIRHQYGFGDNFIDTLLVPLWQGKLPCGTHPV